MQIGRIATTTARIEQHFILWASALHALKTSGKPTEHLRMGFQRLLNKWNIEAKKRFSPQSFNSEISPLRKDLENWWPVRNYMIHGTWSQVGRRYRVDLWEQHKSLEHFSQTFSLTEIRSVAIMFERFLKRVNRVAQPSPSRKKSRKPLVANLRCHHANPVKP